MLKKRRFKLRSDSNDEEEEDMVLSDISDISCPDPLEQPTLKSNKPKKTRHKFTHTEDMNMLKYIMNENRNNEIKGVALWKDMEILQITNHTKQSMKSRFIKTVIPNLHQYDISKSWVDRLSYMFPEIRKKNGDKENAKTNFPLCSMLDKWKRQMPASTSSPKDHGNDEEKKTAKEKENERTVEKKKDANVEDHDSESTIPYIEMTTPSHRWKKRQKYKKPLKFVSSSESESIEEVENNVSVTASTVASTNSLEQSPTKSGDDGSKEDTSSEKSELSDYDKYLVGIAKNTPSSKKSPSSDKNVSQSDIANTTNENLVPDSEEEMDEDASTSILKDRRSRLQHRRHVKKIEKAFGEGSRPSTSSPKKAKKPDLVVFVTESQPDEVLAENIDDTSKENTSTDLSEYETIISDIAKSYDLTNREVLSTIFSFNGNIDKTIAYIKLGPELSQLKPWCLEEDEILSSTYVAGIKEITRKRGKKSVAERLQFLENFTEDVAC